MILDALAFAVVCFIFSVLFCRLCAVPRRRLPPSREVVMVSLIRFEFHSAFFLKKKKKTKHELICVSVDKVIFVVY